MTFFRLWQPCLQDALLWDVGEEEGHGPAPPLLSPVVEMASAPGRVVSGCWTSGGGGEPPFPGVERSWSGVAWEWQPCGKQGRFDSRLVLESLFPWGSEALTPFLLHSLQGSPHSSA